MPTPCARSRRSAANNRATSSAGRLAVGSSSTRISASAASARAIATSDFSVRLRPWMRKSGSMSAPSLASARTARLRAQAQVDHPEATGIAERQTDILGDGHPIDQAEILMDERDRHSPDGVGHVLTRVEDGAAVGRVNAGEDLDERRFAGAVFAEQRDDLAAPDFHLHVVQRLRAAEALRDAARLKHGPSRPATAGPCFAPPAGTRPALAACRIADKAVKPVAGPV